MKRLAIVATLIAMIVVAPSAAASPPCNTDYNDGYGPENLSLNLHNCGAGCAMQELPYLELYEEGISGVRTGPAIRYDKVGTPEFFEATRDDPYFFGVLDLFGPERVLVVVDDTIDDGPNARPTPEEMARKLRSVLLLDERIVNVQFMNEPSNFSGVTVREYTRRYLPLAREVVDEVNRTRPAHRQAKLWSAPWFGNKAGLAETRALVREGALQYIDVLSAHIYADNTADAVALARAHRALSRGVPVAITETNFAKGGVSSYDAQGWWMCEAMTEMERVLRRGLSAEQKALQFNVFYTLRADQERNYNLIRFPDVEHPLFWEFMGSGHVVIQERAKRLEDNDADPSIQLVSPRPMRP